ncbi:ParB/RepB/Spo0J family partition protein [Roseiconus lacunae]|uniref:ParB/RepB/Spo0J family partition protein n=1 Tax=Roseiconus lacunae TaxID=2605694 RepID=A0ABT7PJD0_9BACT|nr:ParB/RepB/Spo0J family partition protein [Roseiconus lacunae]MCD0461764.1 ParB/RepB/Spo0J family partition protein [Roseiconus lacunae]MDM4016593.1 ParB/RepB/Spo0J family partition protein [Roseiconus lacunae]WRQ49462.1 ParB/RepB/Spo0J family partition protein [Stieleria sp. HD01]
MTSSSAGTKDRRLGKGLAALLGSPLDDEGNPLPETNAEGGQASGVKPLMLSVDEIEANPFQPRREFNADEIASLAESIRSHQQLQPILVRIVDGKYQLISGERRLRATVHAGLKEIRAEVREADDRLVAELAIIENLQRKDLNPIEKAMSFKRYIDEHRCKQDDLARRLSIDRSTIANLMRLLELPESVLTLLQDGKITAGHARALLPIGDDQVQLTTAQKIMAERISVRATETLVAEMLREEEDRETGRKVVNATRQKRATLSPHLEAMQQEFRMVFGTKVEIKSSARGKGKITLHFNDNDEFERLRMMLTNESRPSLRVAG